MVSSIISKCTTSFIKWCILLIKFFGACFHQDKETASFVYGKFIGPTCLLIKELNLYKYMKVSIAPNQPTRIVTIPFIPNMLKLNQSET